MALAISWHRMLSSLLLLLAVVPLASGRSQHRHGNGECPEDVTGETQQCFQSYNIFLLGASIDNFYTGVDVEHLRQICRELKQAVRCAERLRNSCPDTEHSDIEIVLQDFISTYQMCHAGNFWEQYARNQNCYRTQGPASEECYHKFQVSPDGGGNIDAQNGDPMAIRSMCRELDELVLCVQRRVAINCDQEASNLVPLILKPTVRMSENCRNTTVEKTTSQPMPTARSAGNHDESDLPSAGHLLHPTALCWLLAATLCCMNVINKMAAR